MEIAADAASKARANNGNQVAAFVASKFPTVKVLKVNPTTGYVTVDLSNADARTKRMLRDADDKSYYLYEEPGKPAVLQVTGPPGNKRSK